MLGKSDAQGVYPLVWPVSAGDVVATIYQLLGVDSRMTVEDLEGRPVPIAHSGAPARELIV